MPSQVYALETETYSSNGRSFMDIDTATNLLKLMLRLDLNYDTGTGGVINGEGILADIIDEVKIGQGSRFPLRFDGQDLPHLSAFLTKSKPYSNPVTSANAAGKTADLDLELPLSIPAGLYPNLSARIEWGTASSIGTDHTVNTMTVNGEAYYSDDPIPPFKVVPYTNETNISSGTKKYKLDAEGKLSGILMICRANSGKALLAGLDTISLRVEGTEIFESEWPALQAAWRRWAPACDRDTAFGWDAGIGVIDLSDELPIIGNNTHLYFEAGATACDVAAYALFEPISRAPASPETTDVLAAEKRPARKLTTKPRGRRVGIAGYTPGPVEAEGMRRRRKLPF